MVITSENIGFITSGRRPRVICPIIFYYYGGLGYSHIAGKKYWKISRVVKVITSENIGFITSGRRPRVINPIFSQVMTITTSDIFQYFCQPCINYIHKYVFHKITQEYYYHAIINCNIKIILYLRQIPQDTQNQI